MGWAESVGCGMSVGLGGSVYIVLVRREARRRPFRFITVCLVWVCLGLVLEDFSRPTVYNILGRRPRALLLGGGGGQLFCGCLWVFV